MKISNVFGKKRFLLFEIEIFKISNVFQKNKLVIEYLNFERFWEEKKRILLFKIEIFKISNVFQKNYHVVDTVKFRRFWTFFKKNWAKICKFWKFRTFLVKKRILLFEIEISKISDVFQKKNKLVIEYVNFENFERF